MNVQGFLMIIYFILSNQQIWAFDGIKLIQSIGNRVCPYTNYCHTDASREFNYTADKESMPSCLPCSCDDECWMLDNCCPDKGEITQHSLIIPCKLSQVMTRLDREVEFDMEVILKQRAGANYRIIDACPPGETNMTLSQKCQGLNKTSLSDYVWVSDSVTGMIYQNIYCIKCHAIEQFWHWMIQTSCKEILETGVNAEKLLSMDCDIINVVPQSEAALVAKYQCFDFDLEANVDWNCSLTTELNQDFVTACSRSTWPFLVGNAISISMYKNVFCFACQFGIEAIIDDVSVQGKMHPLWPPFSALINYVASPEDSKTFRELICHSGQVADPFTDICHELQCPFGKYPWYGVCEKKFADIIFTCLYAIYLIEVIPDPKMVQMDNDTLDNFLYAAMGPVLNHTLKIANWNQTKCHVESCIAKTQNKDNRYPVYLVPLSIRMNRLCDLYDVTANIMSQLGGTTVKFLNDTTLDLDIKLNLNDKDDDEGFNICSFYDECAGVIRLDNEIVCPQIELTYSDAERFSPAQKTERSAFLSFFDSGMVPNAMTAARVCLEEYLETMSATNGVFQTSGSWTVTLYAKFLVYLTLF